MIEATDGGVLIEVKVVPGSSRDAIAGPLGDALKVKVAAPPEGGKANKAVCRLIAAALGVPADVVSVRRGTSHPRKQVSVRGVSAADAKRALAGGG